jgi:hypothetical protein
VSGWSYLPEGDSAKRSLVRDCRPSIWMMNISSFPVRWLSLFLGHCSTWGYWIIQHQSAGLLYSKASCWRRQWWVLWPNQSGPDVVLCLLWQVCLLWFVCEGPRRTPKGMSLPSPAQQVWAWSPATTPRVDSLLWRNSQVSMSPQILCLLVRRPPKQPPAGIAGTCLVYWLVGWTNLLSCFIC